MRFGTVLFDLDGTLVDSAAMILASFRHATRSVLRVDIPDEELLAAVGASTLTAQMEAFGPAHVDDLVAAYRAHNEPLHSGLQPCHGILAVIERLHSQGRRLGIVTAKRRETLALAFAAVPRLERFFDVLVGSEDTERHKPHPEPLLTALARLDSDAADSVYVGDSPFDVQAAKSAGMAAVAVTWGRIHSRGRLERERPDALVDSAEELLAAL